MRVLIIAVGILGLLVFYRVWGWWDDYQARYCIGCEVRTEVVWWREVRENPYYLTIEVEGVDWSCKRQDLACREWKNYQWGDQVQFSGEVKAWVVDGVERSRQVQVETSELVHSREGGLREIWWEVYGLILQVRERMVRVYQRALPEPHASLVAGIVLGERSRMQPEFNESLITTGTLHVVAASGYNITVVANVLLGALVLLVHRRRALVLAGIGVWIYVVLAGMNPPVIRAGIMGMLVLLSQGSGRAYWASWGLALSSLVMLIIAPWWMKDISFQLSIAATAGVLWGVRPVSHFVTKILDRLPARQISQATASKDDGPVKEVLSEVPTRLVLVLKSDLSTTLAATLATVPITLVVFERVSVVSPLVNMLVLWLVPPIMGVGALIGLVGLVSQGIANGLALLIMPLTGLFVGVVNWFAALPGASVTVAGASWWIGVGWWLVLAGWWARSASHHDAQRGGPARRAVTTLTLVEKEDSG